VITAPSAMFVSLNVSYQFRIKEMYYFPNTKI